MGIVPGYFTEKVSHKAQDPITDLLAPIGIDQPEPLDIHADKDKRLRRIFFQHFFCFLKEMHPVIQSRHRIVLRHMLHLLQIPHPASGNGIFQAGHKNPLFVRFDNKVPGAQLQRTLFRGDITVSGHGDHRNPLPRRIFQPFQKLIAIHDRHHNIQENGNDLFAVFFQNRPCLGAVLRFQYIVIVLNHIAQDSSVNFLIFHNQNRISIFLYSNTPSFR